MEKVEFELFQRTQRWVKGWLCLRFGSDEATVRKVA